MDTNRHEWGGVGTAAALLPVPDALTRLLQGVAVLPSEVVPLDQAQGRVLAGYLVCGEDRPAFDRSAMDGVAVAGETAGRYSLVGEVPVGGAHDSPLTPGQAVRIFTGAAVPTGASRVIPQEEVRIEGPDVVVERVPGPRFIRRRGDDARQGQVLLAKGGQLRSPELALLAQEGVVRPEVIRRPRLAHLVTGSELVDPSRPAGPGALRDTNSALVAGLAAEAGMALVGQQRVADEFSTAAAALRRLTALEPDLIVVSGGAGPGDHDLGRRLLDVLEMSVVFHGVDLRPGKPLLAGRNRTCQLLVMPGNPVSHWVTWQLFVRPLMAAWTGSLVTWASRPRGGSLGGTPKSQGGMFRLPLAADWTGGSDPRDVWWPGRLVVREGRLQAEPLRLASSGDLCGLSGAEALLHLGCGPHLPAGAEVDVLLP